MFLKVQLHCARLILLGLAAMTLAACAAMPGARMMSIEGSVWYRERIAPPTDAVIRIILENATSTELIAETRFMPQGGPPWAFTLAYDPQRIDAQGRYNLRAELRSGGKIMFTSLENIPAFEISPARIMMSMVGGQKARAAAGIPDVSLTETYWKLTVIEGAPAELGVDGRELNLMLNTDGTRVNGYSGCNSFTGSYTTFNDSVEFFGMASTMKACPAGMEQETRFLQALKRTREFQVIGDQLQLKDDNGKTLLEFVAVDLP
jgi:putative lipoprotein